ncbi:MAG: hypothetical protein F4057_05825, partial [Acidobacteria bacterium]|nr:hypothetical protein [Acidobacteriota bacterium]
MSTIRIYKVSELLGIPSQEVIDLLRRDHGIEVKSASSTVEEIVARQFAERVARERGIRLPTRQPFSGSSAYRLTAKRGRQTPQKAEPPKPAAPTLGPPRLVKAAKAARIQARAEAEAQAKAEEEARLKAEGAAGAETEAPSPARSELPTSAPAGAATATTPATEEAQPAEAPKPAAPPPAKAAAKAAAIVAKRTGRIAPPP